jgi:hypothetical protein
MVPNLFKYVTTWRYYKYTLQNFFSKLRFPLELQAILAGQSGCYFLPPEKVSLLAHATVVGGYNNGAYYLKKHIII